MAIRVFCAGGHDIRLVLPKQAGEWPEIVASDLAKAMGIRNASDMLAKQVDQDYVHSRDVGEPRKLKTVDIAAIMLLVRSEKLAARQLGEALLCQVFEEAKRANQECRKARLRERRVLQCMRGDPSYSSLEEQDRHINMLHRQQEYEEEEGKREDEAQVGHLLWRDPDEDDEGPPAIPCTVAERVGMLDKNQLIPKSSFSLIGKMVAARVRERNLSPPSKRVRLVHGAERHLNQFTKPEELEILDEVLREEIARASKGRIQSYFSRK